MSGEKRPESFDDVLLELQDEFLALLPERVDELRSALTLLDGDPAARTTMQRLGHRIGGTAATVGLESVGALGRAIERFVAARTECTPDDLALLAAVVTLLDEWTLEALRPGGRRDPGLLSDPRLVALSAARVKA